MYVNPFGFGILVGILTTVVLVIAFGIWVVKGGD